LTCARVWYMMVRNHVQVASEMTVELVIIEGFYGPVWSWAERRQLVSTLATHGYGFYLYAPKADPYLRRRWQEPHPAEQIGALTEFAMSRLWEWVRTGV